MDGCLASPWSVSVYYFRQRLWKGENRRNAYSYGGNIAFPHILAYLANVTDDSQSKLRFFVFVPVGNCKKNDGNGGGGFIPKYG